MAKNLERFNLRNCWYPTKEGTCREAKALSSSPLYDLEEVEPYLYMFDVFNVVSIPRPYTINCLIFFTRHQ